MDQTKGLIIGTVTLTAATTFVHQAGKGVINFRAYLGASFMGIFLTGIAMANPRLARNFAVLICFGVLLNDKGQLFTFAANATGQSPKPHGPATIVGMNAYGQPENQYGGVGTVQYGPYPVQNVPPIIAPPPAPPGASL